jgi:hypothetical protein
LGISFEDATLGDDGICVNDRVAICRSGRGFPAKNEQVFNCVPDGERQLAFITVIIAVTNCYQQEVKRGGMCSDFHTRFR